MLVAVSYDRDSPLDTYASGSAAHSGRKASHAPTAAVTAAAGDAYYVANDATTGVRAAPKAASTDGAVSTTAAASTDEGNACIATVGDTATTTDYITVCQATPAVVCDIARASVADGGPPFDRDAALDTGDSASARYSTTVSDQTGATAATKDVTDDARRGPGREELGNRAHSKVATSATTDSVTDARREWAGMRGSPGRFLRVLRGLGGPDRTSR